jgi:hypothetical protein
MDDRNRMGFHASAADHTGATTTAPQRGAARRHWPIPLGLERQKACAAGGRTRSYQSLEGCVHATALLQLAATTQTRPVNYTALTASQRPIPT